jgi:hypothetical protein
MSDISASFILSYLQENMDNIIKHHKKLYKMWKVFVNSKIPKIRFYPDQSNIIFPSCIAILFDHTVEENIFSNLGARKYYKLLVYDLSTMNSTIDIYNKIVCFPYHIDITMDDTEKMIQKVRNYIE